MSREVEDFKPLKDNKVSFYSCGPTVYDYSHIGNLRTYIFSDILKRVLLFNGYSVKHVMNITDVGHLTSDADEGEDKIEKSAAKSGKSAKEITKFYAEAFKGDLKKLNIIEPNKWCKASAYIKEQIAMIQALEEKGFTYKTSDGIYFDTSKVKNYGALARLNLVGQEAGSRVEINPEKKNPHDFALWKFSPKDKQRLQEWKSPWAPPGRDKAFGFPGWHTECSAMSIKNLGETIDIHTGAIDLMNVHHVNEICQSEAVTGKPFVRYWVHGEFLLIDNGRMGKSVGNFITLNSVIEKGIAPIVYRFFCLSAHYRSKLNFSWEALQDAANGWDKFKNKFLELGKKNGKVDEKLLTEFKTVINDDLAMPQALAVAWNVFKSDISNEDKRATLVEFDKVLGLGLNKLKKEKSADVPAEIIDLIKQREQFRVNKQWAEADAARKKIEGEGWEVEDTGEGTKVMKNTINH